jgi:feruloyl-CoA ortho-hydroxylase
MRPVGFTCEEVLERIAGYMSPQFRDAALIINIGDVLQIMSNDKYKSIEHLAFVNKSKNRVSIPIFVNPGHDAIIGPLPEVLEGGEKPMYKHLVFSYYFRHFFSKTHDGKKTIEFAKIWICTLSISSE